VRTANDGIVLSGTVSSITRLDGALFVARAICSDRVSKLNERVGGTQQVMLKVRFAEMQAVLVAKKPETQALGFPTGNAPTVIPGQVAVLFAVSQASPIGAANQTSGLDNRQEAFNDRPWHSAVQVNIPATEALEQTRCLCAHWPSRKFDSTFPGQEASFLAGGNTRVPVV